MPIDSPPLSAPLPPGLISPVGVPLGGSLPVPLSPGLAPPSAEECDQPTAEREEACSEEAGHDAEDTFRAGLTLLLLLSLIQKALGFVRSVVVCRWLSPEHLGTWAMCQALMDTAVPLLLLSIPGCFGRYVEHYRQRGQLRSFVAWSMGASGVGLLVGTGLALIGEGPLSRFVFGTADQTALFRTCVAAAIPAATFAFSVELLVGLRRTRWSVSSHFLRGVLFTGGTMAGLLLAPPDAKSLVWAYGGSFAVSAILAAALAWCFVREVRGQDQSIRPLATLCKVAPAIAGFWMTDFLNNLFVTVDRYMLVNLSRGTPQQVLAQVGNYESAAVFPAILVSITVMAARMLLPHQAMAWERGDRAGVTRSINVALQAAACALFFLAFGLLEARHLIFSVAFRGQYLAGESVLPIVLTFYVWSALSAVLVNYFWCVEKTHWAALAMLVGLVSNGLLNFWLVPTQGIVGAGIATAIANLVQLAMLGILARMLGLRISGPTLGTIGLPLALCGPSYLLWPAAGYALLRIACLALGGRRVSGGA